MPPRMPIPELPDEPTLRRRGGRRAAPAAAPQPLVAPSLGDPHYMEHRAWYSRFLEREHGPQWMERMASATPKGRQGMMQTAYESFMAPPARRGRGARRGMAQAEVLFTLGGFGVGASQALDRWLPYRPLGAKATPTRLVLVALLGTAVGAQLLQRRQVRDVSAALAAGVAAGELGRAIAAKAA